MVNPPNFILVNSVYTEMGFKGLFSERIAEAALLLTAALTEQNTEKRIFVRHL